MEKDNMPDLSGILSKVMGNPEAMAMLSSLLGSQMPKIKEEKKEEDADIKEAIALPAPQIKEIPAREKRKRLLLALKPFLSSERASAVDRILMITDALSLLQSEKRT